MYSLLQLWPFSFLSFFISIASCGIFIRYFRNIRVQAKSDKRRLHNKQISQLGGVAILLAVFSAFMAYAFYKQKINLDLNLTYIGMSLITALVFGVLDDIYELRARWKFLGHNLITFFLIMGLQNFTTPIDEILGTKTLPSILLQWFWCLGVLNSINLIDGLDGLASGIGMIVIGTLCALNQNSETNILLGSVCIPAILGFYFWNRNPAKIFLGESGAQCIAIFLFLAAMTFKGSNSNTINFLAPLFALGVPIFDTLMAIARRIYRRTGLMSADREHIHHRFMRLGLNQINTARFLHGITLYLCFISYDLVKVNSFNATSIFLLLSGLCINAILLMIAEQKLYSFLTNFTSHIIEALDENRQDTFSVQYRVNQFYQTQTPFMLHKLNLEVSVKSLLEKSPVKIKNFYHLLGLSLRNINNIEIFFQNSTHVIIITKLYDKTLTENEVQHNIMNALSKIEEDLKIDLYLNLRNTLRFVEYYQPTTNERKRALYKVA